jgi:hypothetical protein
MSTGYLISSVGAVLLPARGIGAAGLGVARGLVASPHRITTTCVAAASDHTHQCAVIGASTTRGHGPGASNDREHPGGA